jgi:thiamine-phosphate pyrophosphorylase
MNKPHQILAIPRTWNLYIITDEQLSRGKSHLEIAREALEGGADVIQLRDKSAGSYKLYRTGQELRTLINGLEVSYIVNDRIDIAMATDADGVHLGQEDLPAPVARRLIGPGKILGVSASSLEEALRARDDGADYLGVGPVFEARGTKSDAGEPRGLSFISRIRENCDLPIVAIGGINEMNLSEVIRAGADAAAIISAVVCSENITKTVAKLKQIILSAKGVS